MKRKIIKQANQAYTITLPIKWVRKLNLTEKSEINVEEKDRTLIINSDNRVKGEKVKINLNEIPDGSIKGILNALYAGGADEIDIRCDKDISGTINKVLSGLMGYALISQEEGNYTIKDLNFGNFPNLDEVFKRVFQMIIIFHDSALKDIFGKEEENIDSLNSRDTEINKFCLYLQRSINKMYYEDDIKGRVLFTYSYNLEKIGDEIVRLWRTNIKYTIKKDKPVKEIAELSKEGLERAFDFYFQLSLDGGEKIYSLRDKARIRFMDVKGDATTLRFIRHSLKIIEDAADLAHLTLMIKLEGKQ